MAKDIILICAIGGFLIACAPDAGTECARRFAEIAEACPVGTAFVAAASSTSECGGGASILTGSSGEVTGYCARQGECVVQCQVQPNFCSCGVESFTKERISCSPCTGACPLPGQSVCNGQTIVECSNEGQWSARETCRDGNVCAGADGTARCSSPAPSGGEDGGVRSTDAGTFVSSRTLSSTIGLVFWLDADDAESIEFENGRIVAWRNKSPIVSDTLVPETTDSQPQYEAPGSHHGGAVRFRGYQSLLGTTTYQLGDSMAFVRFRTRMAIWSQSIFYIGWETQLGNRPEWAGCCMATELAGARIYHTNGYEQSYGPAFPRSRQDAVMSTWMTLRQQFFGTVRPGRTHYLTWIDGNEAASGPIDEPYAVEETIRVGGYPFRSGLTGDIAEILIYNRHLSDAEVAEVEAYLAEQGNVP